MRQMLFASIAVAAISVGLPALAAPIDKQVTIRPIMLCDDGGANCATVNTYEAASDKIWAQAGIDFAFLPTVQWNSSQFRIVDSELPTVVGITPVVGEEFPMFAAGSTLFGDPAVTGVMNMYFVEDFLTSLGTLYGEGCGAPVFSAVCINQSGIVINSSAVNAFNGGLGRIDTVAHEVGHVLGLGHGDFGAGGADNLMTAGSGRTPAANLANINPDGSALDKLLQAQIDEARSSDYVSEFVPTPEPASMMVLAMGLLGLGVTRRRGA